MKKQWMWLAAAVVLAAGLMGYGTVAQAVTIGLSSPDDLSSLTAGQMITVNVSVDDLGAFTEINLILAEVLVPSDVFAAPALADVTVNPALAGLVTPAVFPGAPPALPHVVTGFFNDLGISPIISVPTLLYSVALTVDNVGPGVLQIDPLTLLVLADGDPINPVSPVITNALAFGVVPEPTTAALGLLAGAGLLGLSRRRRRAA